MRGQSDAETRRALADVVIVNPVGGALRHYSERLLETLRASQRQVRLLSILEPSASGTSRAGWVLRYLAALHEARRSVRPNGKIIVTWPVLGHLDRPVVAMSRGRADGALVMHDPQPLVRAVGYGPVSRFVTSRLLPRAELVVHSEVAEQDLALCGLTATLVPHPLIADTTHASPDGPVLRVLGQWKQDRDTDLLALLGSALSGVRLEIVGRGWPALPGWSVRDEYVSESELDRLVATSSAVLIPYKRFYQSGIAARGLEAAVPVIGPRRELASMTGEDYPFLVSRPSDAAEWLETIGRAVKSNRQELERIRSEVAHRALMGWTGWTQR